jgi:hypothetical protein
LLGDDSYLSAFLLFHNFLELFSPIKRKGWVFVAQLLRSKDDEEYVTRQKQLARKPKPKPKSKRQKKGEIGQDDVEQAENDLDQLGDGVGEEAENEEDAETNEENEDDDGDKLPNLDPVDGKKRIIKRLRVKSKPANCKAKSAKAPSQAKSSQAGDGKSKGDGKSSEATGGKGKEKSSKAGVGKSKGKGKSPQAGKGKQVTNTAAAPAVALAGADAAAAAAARAEDERVAELEIWTRLCADLPYVESWDTLHPEMIVGIVKEIRSKYADKQKNKIPPNLSLDSKLYTVACLELS